MAVSREGRQFSLLHVFICVRSWLSEGTADDSRVTMLRKPVSFNTYLGNNLIRQYVDIILFL